MNKIQLVIAILFSGTLLSGCFKNPESRGYAIENSESSQIKAGVTTKDEAVQILGTPTSKSLYGEETWYYIGQKLERTGFFDPNLVEQKAVAITFDKNGVVDKLNMNQGENNRAIALAKDKTPTEGNKVTIAEQFLGNLGRFNPDTKKQKRKIDPRKGY